MQKTRKVNKLVIHCSDSDDSLDVGFREINDWHKENGWLSKISEVSCGYHYIIRRNGKIEKGRLEEEIGAHCYGQNRMSIGICLVGRKNFDQKQIDALRGLSRRLLDTYSLKPFDVHGHYEFDDRKTCPNMDMHQVRLDIFFQRSKAV